MKKNILSLLLFLAINTFAQTSDIGNFKAIRLGGANITESGRFQIKGTIIYNTSLNKFRVYQNGTWLDVITTPSGLVDKTNVNETVQIFDEENTLDTSSTNWVTVVCNSPMLWNNNSIYRVVLFFAGVNSTGSQAYSSKIEAAVRVDNTGLLSIVGTNTTDTKSTNAITITLTVSTNTLLLSVTTTTSCKMKYHLQRTGTDLRF